MKKKILIALTAILILGLAAAAYAFNKTNVSSKTASSACCCSGDSCPMKSKDAKTTGGEKQASCCDKDDCCCKGDSCPMKKQGENTSANCCGDSCPMKDKETQASSVADTKNVVVASSESCCQKGASCCDGGACCKHKS